MFQPHQCGMERKRYSVIGDDCDFAPATARWHPQKMPADRRTPDVRSWTRGRLAPRSERRRLARDPFRSSRGSAAVRPELEQ